MNGHGGTVAVVVAYHPGRESLATLLDALATQISSVVVVDNSEDGNVGEWLAARARTGEHLIAFGENRGVAAAQNAGIAWARARGARYVVLFDQDSEPAADMVARLLAAAGALSAQGYRVAAVGARHVDPRQPGPPAFTRLRGLSRKTPAPGPDGMVAVDHLISSGCLIPLAAIDAVGAMNEALFIDYVDIEWGLRARRQGYLSFGVAAAVLTHRLGDAPLRFLGRRFPSHPPIRHYYQFRNAVWMYRQPWLPPNWKFADGLRLLKRCVLIGLCATDRREHLTMMWRGVRDGVHGHLGRYGTARGSR